MAHLIGKPLGLALALATATTPALAQVTEWTEETITSNESQAKENQQQAELAQEAIEETNEANEQARQAYEQALEEREALIRSRQEAYEAELARLAREHEEAMERWRADVAACKAGERDRCAQE